MEKSYRVIRLSHTCCTGNVKKKEKKERKNPKAKEIRKKVIDLEFRKSVRKKQGQIKHGIKTIGKEKKAGLTAVVAEAVAVMTAAMIGGEVSI